VFGNGAQVECLARQVLHAGQSTNATLAVLVKRARSAAMKSRRSAVALDLDQASTDRSRGNGSALDGIAVGGKRVLLDQIAGRCASADKS
jgi:hypothetical protein